MNTNGYMPSYKELAYAVVTMQEREMRLRQRIDVLSDRTEIIAGRLDMVREERDAALAELHDVRQQLENQERLQRKLTDARAAKKRLHTRVKSLIGSREMWKHRALDNHELALNAKRNRYRKED